MFSEQFVFALINNSFDQNVCSMYLYDKQSTYNNRSDSTRHETTTWYSIARANKVFPLISYLMNLFYIMYICMYVQIRHYTNTLSENGI